MRIAVFGRQLITINGEFIGLNLGYNYYAEHENEAVYKLLVELNQVAKYHMWKDIKPGLFKNNKFEKKISREKEKINKWGNTTFNGKVLLSCLEPFRREIVIKNEKDSNIKHLLAAGSYSLVALHRNIDSSYWDKKYNKRRTFEEGDFIYIGDYTSYSNNTGYALTALNTQINYTSVGVLGTWDSEGVILFFDDKKMADSFCEALSNGNLALVDYEPRLFYDRGCCFINLEAAYRIRI